MILNHGQHLPLFTSMIINNKGLNDVQRMQYLKTSVKGNAAKLINKLEISNDNFHVAWKLLGSRYENKRARASLCLYSLINLPNIKRPNTDQVQQLLDTSREYMTSIKELEVEHVILHILSRKLSPECKDRYESSLKNPKELQSLEESFAFLEQRAQVLQSLQLGIDREKSKEFFPTCYCCNEKHALFTCSKFKKMNW